MICDNCKVDRLVSDFLNNQNICYKCSYRKKTEKTVEKRTEPKLLCRTCGKEFFHQKDLKKRQRTVFCSYECAETGHKKLTENHWTRKLRAADSWKSGGEGKWNTNQI